MSMCSDAIIANSSLSWWVLGYRKIPNKKVDRAKSMVWRKTSLITLRFDSWVLDC